MTDDDSVEMKFIIPNAKKAQFLSYTMHKYTVKTYSDVAEVLVPQ